MTTPTSGQISIYNLKNEFGGPASPSLFDYYAYGANVPGSIAGIPTGGTISLFQFYNKTKVYPVQYFSPGTYYVTVPLSTNVFAAFIVGGGGGGGGGGGAGENQWMPSAGGGGGGGGGAGQDIAGAWNVTPGSTLTIVVGSGGAGGAGGSGAFGARGDSARYDGYDGGAGGAGGQSYIAGVVAVSGGAGGSPGPGAIGDNGYAIIPGGSSGAGWGAGQPGQYAHIVGSYYLSNYTGGSSINEYANIQGGSGGAGSVKPYAGNVGNGGAGGAGGSWDTYSNGYFPPNRIGSNGAAARDGNLILQFGTTTPPFSASGNGYSGAVGSPQPPYDPIDHYVPGPCVGAG